MATIKELRRERDPVLMRSVNYIQDLATEFQMDVSGWDLDAVFPSPDKKHRLMTRAQDMNRAFFKYKKEFATEAQLSILPKDELDVTVKNLKSQVKDLRIQTQNQQYEAQDLVRSHMAIVRDNLRRVNECRRVLKALSSEAIAEEIKECIQVYTEAFTFAGIHSGRRLFQIQFDLKESVTLKYARRDGIVYRVPMGLYRVSIEPLTFEVKMYALRNNVYFDNYYHPHIEGDGHVCWGDAAENISSALAKGDFKKILEIANAHLRSYNDVSPYVGLEDFYYNGQGPNGEQPWREGESKDLADGADDFAREEDSCPECGGDGCYECRPDDFPDEE